MIHTSSEEGYENILISRKKDQDGPLFPGRFSTVMVKNSFLPGLTVYSRPDFSKLVKRRSKGGGGAGSPFSAGVISTRYSPSGAPSPSFKVLTRKVPSSWISPRGPRTVLGSFGPNTTIPPDNGVPPGKTTLPSTLYNLGPPQPAAVTRASITAGHHRVGGVPRREESMATSLIKESPSVGPDCLLDYLCGRKGCLEVRDRLAIIPHHEELQNGPR